MKIKKFVFFIKLLFFVFMVLLIINFISGYFSVRVKTYVKQKATNVSSLIIANSIQEEVLPSIDLEGLIHTVITDNNIDSIYINTYQVNDILSKTMNSITNELNNLNNEDLSNLTLPLGTVISDILFYEVGPNINIRLIPVGSVVCDIKSVIEEYGINNSIFRLELKVKVSFSVVIPLQREEIDVVTSIPIVVQIIQGEVPMFYFNNKNGNILPGPN